MSLLNHLLAVLFPEYLTTSVFSTIRDALSVVALRIRRKYGYGSAWGFLLFNCSFEKSIVYFIPYCFNEIHFDPITLLNVLNPALLHWAYSHRGNIVESQPRLIRRCPSAFYRENAKKTRGMLQRHTNSFTPAFARQFHALQTPSANSPMAARADFRTLLLIS
jgi:hypothetical protein